MHLLYTYFKEVIPEATNGAAAQSRLGVLFDES